jgi:hypothetical protein
VDSIIVNPFVFLEVGRWCSSVERGIVANGSDFDDLAAALDQSWLTAMANDRENTGLPRGRQR